MMQALAKDPGGIAFCGFGHQTPSVKAVALSVRDAGPFIELTKANVANRTYPLTRTVYFFVNQAASTPGDRTAREFLRYILSREGQSEIPRQEIYLPLTAEAAREQVQKFLR